AWGLDGAQKRQRQLSDLRSRLRTHGVEVQQSDAPFSVAVDWPPSAKKEKTDFAKGSFIIRMDQPYSRLADAMIDVQYVRGDEKVYDDTGWTLGYLKNVEFKRVANPDVLKVSMHAWTGAPAATSSNIIENNADTS